MITVYTKKSNSSCKKAIEWLQKNNIAYEERVVSDSAPLTEKEVIRILYLSNDIFEIISVRNKVYKKLDKDIWEMRIKSELIPYISKNVSMLTFSIAIQGNKMQLDFNEEELRVFIPKNRRKEKVEEMLVEL